MAERPRQNGRWKDARQCLGETRERLAISFRLLLLPFGHDRLPRTRRHGAIEAVKPSSPVGRSKCGPRSAYAAEMARSIGSRIEGSSFSGLLPRVEIGHIRMVSAGNDKK